MSDTDFHSQLSDLLQSRKEYKEENRGHHWRFLTVSRQTGARGITLSRLIAKELNRLDAAAKKAPWVVFDNELTAEILKENKLPAFLESVLEEDELVRLKEEGEALVKGYKTAELIEDINHTLLHLAGIGNVILVGHAANIVTAARGGGFHLRLVADEEKRINHLTSYYGIDNEHACRMMESEDTAAAEYCRKYFDKDIDNPLTYDLVANTGCFEEETLANSVAHLAMHKFGRFLKTDTAAV